MSLVKTEYKHIAIGEDGVPIIASTTMKVVELVVEKMAYGWSPEKLHFQHPYLSLGQRGVSTSLKLSYTSPYGRAKVISSWWGRLSPNPSRV